jgi:hypothetical protein
MTSPDGITWTARTSTADIQWDGVTYGNGKFVAVAANGTGNGVMTSPDGITWTTRTPASDNAWNSVVYGNGLFVAVSTTGTGNRVMTSPDGITWTSRTSAADNQWTSVTYGDGLFVAVANTGLGNRVMTSQDGIIWTARQSAVDNSWQSVTYGNGLFVAIAVGLAPNAVMTSGKIENTNLATNNILQGIWNFMQGLGIGTTTNQYGGSLVDGITLGMKNILGTQIASVLQIGSATSTSNVSTTSNALYNVNGSLYFNGAQLGTNSQTVATVTASTTLSGWNTTYFVNDVAGAGSLLLTLPTPVGNSGKTIEIKKVSTTTNAITLLVNSTTTQLIDGSIAYTLTQYNNAVVIRSDGTNYQVVANTGSGQVGASFLRAKLNTDQTTDTSGGVDHIKFATVTNSNGGDVVLDTTSAYSSTANTASIGRFTLKAGKTYRLVSDVQGVNATTNRFSYEWFNADTNTTLGGGRGYTVGSSDSNSAATRGSTAEAIYTPSVDTRVEVKITGNVLSTISSDSSGQMSTYAFIEVIAGNAPVTGSSVDYVYATLPANQTITTAQVAAGQDINLSATVSGNIPNVNGVFTLTAGKTYKLDANLRLGAYGGANDQLIVAWVDSSNNMLASSTRITDIPTTFSSGGNYDSNSRAYLIYTPTTNQTVKLRTISGTVTTSVLVDNSASFASIQQLGSTATTEYTNNVLGDFPTGGVIMAGTLSEYINHIQVTQTTQYQTLSLPNPTNTALSRIVYIDNIGTANFDMHGITIVAGGTGAFKWNGTAWKNFGIVGGNVAIASCGLFGLRITRRMRGLVSE